jgi:H+/gluconate symporter-like permease
VVGGFVFGGIVAHSGLGAELDQALSAVSMPNKVAV